MTKRSKNCPRIFNNFLSRPFIHDGAITSLLSEEKDEEGSFHDNHSKLSISHRRGVKWRGRWRGIGAVHPPGGRERTNGNEKRIREFQSVALPGPSTGAALRGWPVYWIPQKFLTTPLFERRPFSRSPSREARAFFPLARSSTPPLPPSPSFALSPRQKFRDIPARNTCHREHAVGYRDSVMKLRFRQIHRRHSPPLSRSLRNVDQCDPLQFREQTSLPSIFHGDLYDLHIDWNYNFEIFTICILHMINYKLNLEFYFLNFLFSFVNDFTFEFIFINIYKERNNFLRIFFVYSIDINSLCK